MITAAAGAGRAWRLPRRRLLAGALVVSGLLNLCFIAGAAWTRFNPPPAWQGWEQRYQRMAAELDLDPTQRAGFDKYVAAMRSRAQKMHEEVDPSMAAVWDEIAKPAADQTRVLRALDDVASKRHDFQREATVQTLDFLSLLTPAQRGKFVAISRESRSHRQRGQGHKP